MTYKNVHGKIRVDQVVKKKVPLTTVWHKQQNRGRCEFKEENLAPLRLTTFITTFLLLSMVEL